MNLAQIEKCLKSAKIDCRLSDKGKNVLASVAGPYTTHTMFCTPLDNAVRVQILFPSSPVDLVDINLFCGQLRERFDEALEFGYYPEVSNFSVAAHVHLEVLDIQLPHLAKVCDEVLLLFKVVANGDPWSSELIELATVPLRECGHA